MELVRGDLMGQSPAGTLQHVCLPWLWDERGWAAQYDTRWCLVMPFLLISFFSSSLPAFCLVVELMFWEVMRLRREMSLAKLGFYPNEI